jgi:hypothetical protein
MDTSLTIQRRLRVEDVTMEVGSIISSWTRKESEAMQTPGVRHARKEIGWIERVFRGNIGNLRDFKPR